MANITAAVDVQDSYLPGSEWVDEVLLILCGYVALYRGLQAMGIVSKRNARRAKAAAKEDLAYSDTEQVRPDVRGRVNPATTVAPMTKREPTNGAAVPHNEPAWRVQQRANRSFAEPVLPAKKDTRNGKGFAKIPVDNKGHESASAVPQSVTEQATSKRHLGTWTTTQRRWSTDQNAKDSETVDETCEQRRETAAHGLGQASKLAEEVNDPAGELEPCVAVAVQGASEHKDAAEGDAKELESKAQRAENNKSSTWSTSWWETDGQDGMYDNSYGWSYAWNSGCEEKEVKSCTTKSNQWWTKPDKENEDKSSFTESKQWWTKPPAKAEVKGHGEGKAYSWSYSWQSHCQETRTHIPGAESCSLWKKDGQDDEYTRNRRGEHSWTETQEQMVDFRVDGKETSHQQYQSSHQDAEYTRKRRWVHPWTETQAWLLGSHRKTDWDSTRKAPATWFDSKKPMQWVPKSTPHQEKEPAAEVVESQGGRRRWQPKRESIADAK
mmetsp:Transcript_31563/g.71724  ORF Transcript_31563/g.71724 Transcript_31563/m.71724 type:complete len:495 (-) Transcript_31563:157-1641(-)